MTGHVKEAIARELRPGIADFLARLGALLEEIRQDVEEGGSDG